MRRTPLLIALVVIASIGVVPQPVVADDAWAESCTNAETIEPGSYSGRLSPQDRDAFIVDGLSKGDFIVGSFMYDLERVPNVDFKEYNSNVRDGAYLSDFSMTGENAWTVTSNYDIEIDEDIPDGETGEFRLYNEGPENGVCVVLETTFARSTSWELSFSINEAEPPELVSPSELAELESQIEQKNQRISDLESLLEQKNQTIAQLEQESGEVSVDVEVAPAGDQQNFVAGGEARITANSENAEWDKFSVEYQGDTYSVDSSGTAAIPLSGTGEQQMMFRYGDTTQTVSLNVQAQSEGQSDTSNSTPRNPDVQDENDPQQNQDNGASGAFGPGFGIVAAVIALLAIALVIALLAIAYLLGQSG